MSKFTVRQSIVSTADSAVLFESIRNFNHWPAWSPFHILDPGVSYNVNSAGDFYEWDGPRIGAGNMRITGIESSRKIHYELTFLRPWKSVSQGYFELLPSEKGTEVVWFLESSLPFFLFFMKKQMSAFIGMDFSRGLRMLKDYAEKGSVPSKLEFRGISTYPATSYIGLENTAGWGNIGEVMSRDIDRLSSFFRESNEQMQGPPFVIYTKMDVLKETFAFVTAFPIANVDTSRILPTGMFIGQMPAVSVYTIRHTGSYEHLGNAWSAGNTLQRSKGFKAHKKQKPFEVYRSNPLEVPASEIITDICFPVA